jgi:hypothetical protein
MKLPTLLSNVSQSNVPVINSLFKKPVATVKKTACNQLPSVLVVVAHIWQFKKTGCGPVFLKKAKNWTKTGL